MKNSYLSILLLSFLLSLVFISCSNDDEEQIKPLTESQIKEALILRNNEVLRTKINAYLSQFPTNESTTDDDYKKMFNSLIENFNSLNGINVTYSCYNCIYTLPPKSEIDLEIDTSSEITTRVLVFQINQKTYKFELMGTHTGD